MARFAPEWVSDYRQEWLRADIVAGLTASAVVIPKALAYATVAGLPVQAGLYTAFAPMAVYAALGSSRVLSVSTTTTIAILTGAALEPMAAAGDATALAQAAATLALLVGAILVLARLLRLGFVANFISEPVLVGFKAGIGAVIILDQLPKLLGVHIDKGGFLHNLLATIGAVPQASLATVAVSVATMAILLGLAHLSPRSPAPLVAVGVAVAAVWLLDIERFGISIVGTVPTGLPAPIRPDWPLVAQLWPAATGIALMSFTETIAAGRAFARGDEPVPGANRELLATGIATTAGAFLGALPAGGGTSQTAVNRVAGARSQLAGLVCASVALGTCVFLAPLIGLMPNATLAAVVIVYSVGLIKPAEFLAILQVRRTEFIWALVALVGVMALGTLQGIVVAIIVSLVALAYQVSDPPVHVLGRKPGTNVFRPLSAAHPEDESFPGLLMLRPEGRIFFANADRIREKIQLAIAQYEPRVVVLDLSRVFDMEYTALKMLGEAEERQRERGVTLWLAGLNPGVLDVVKKTSLSQTLGNDRMMFNLEQALDTFRSRT
ncbi:SulP family inorganic anion transporter [Variovorax sp.]|uniref:SulP family inorganic anion transporter n=1 Tax=Variovorax sp. TaxID=1871043 RepID=UPI002D404AC2|nr:SulP family inorganic anion transporter [Variovorax sp.]HYP83309.1 SulP family inorganic anion transporter [Variovorax sp.]